MGDFPKLM